MGVSRHYINYKPKGRITTSYPEEVKANLMHFLQNNTEKCMSKAFRLYTNQFDKTYKIRAFSNYFNKFQKE